MEIVKDISKRVLLFIASMIIAVILYETLVKWGVSHFILIKMTDIRGKIIMYFFRVGSVVLIYVLILLGLGMKVSKPFKTILWIAYLGTVFLLLFARKSNSSGYNLDPFYIVHELHGLRNKIYFVGNIVFFIPFGYLFRKLNFFIMIFVSLCMEFTIEMMQHITRRGYFDVCDIMVNMSGILFGYIVYHIIRFVFKRKEKKRVKESRRRGA